MTPGISSRRLYNAIKMIMNLFTFSGESSKKLNAQQKTAVINIVERRNGSMPYLLFGPPGTGKTCTLAAVIEEIIRDPQKLSHVLVCTNSNAACDEIAERLLAILHKKEILRLYAVSYDRKKIDMRFEEISNWDKAMGTFAIPALKHLYSFRVVVCTLATAGIFARAYENPGYAAGHFSHIILDESACTHETMTLVAIAGKLHTGMTSL